MCHGRNVQVLLAAAQHPAQGNEAIAAHVALDNLQGKAAGWKHDSMTSVLRSTRGSLHRYSVQYLAASAQAWRL